MTTEHPQRQYPCTDCTPGLLLWFCLRPEVNFTENELWIAIDRRRDETIALFHTDTALFRKHFYGPEPINPAKGERVASDLLYFYKYDDKVPILAFVELKRGSAVQHAIDQLTRVANAVTPGIRATLGSVIGKPNGFALLIRDRSTSSMVSQNLQKEFMARTGMRLQVKTAALNVAVDLREQLAEGFSECVAESLYRMAQPDPDSDIVSYGP